jgi:ATP-dependent helicase/DNAse subunit B
MVCTLEELYRLIEKAHSIAVKLTEEIRQGCIQVSPIIEKNNNSQCKWCSFAGVCRHDPTEAHDRIIPNISLSDLLSDKPFSSETEKETE